MDDWAANTPKFRMLNKLYLFMLFATIFNVHGKKHKLKLEEDSRKTIDLTTFGFLQDSFIQINITGFTTGLKPETADNEFGFTFNKLESSGMSYLENKDYTCLLKASDRRLADDNIAIIVFKMDFTNKKIHVERKGNDVQNISLSTDQRESFGSLSRRKRSLDSLRDSYLIPTKRLKRQLSSQETGDAAEKPAEPAKPAITTVIPANPSIKPIKPAESNPAKPATKPQTINPPTIKPADSKTNLVEKQPNETIEKDETETKTAVKVAPVKANEIEDDSVITDSFHMDVDEQGKFSFMFVAYIDDKNEEGLYELYFHNCLSSEDTETKPSVNFTAYLIEKNGDNYLSAGHIPLPMIYFILSVIFFGMACVWLYVLKKSTDKVYKLHYLMLILIYTKALALLFHAVNYHFMAEQGHHEEAIAIIYYITYLMRGILLFVTIVLIGAGWAFVKYILSDRDKKIFIIIIPLQVLANVAQIIIEETEEGESQFLTWNEIFIIVDLLCCGAILFPVVWSIRHLQEASQTDGKAAISLVKLKLFRHFYILIVCYIYFTRIIMYLLRIAVPFEYEWLDEMFKELATVVFYVVTGYKFRPATDNPYLQVPQDSDDEVEMDEVVTQSGALEGLTKVNVKFSNGNGESTTTTTANKRESSHEYD